MTVLLFIATILLMQFSGYSLRDWQWWAIVVFTGFIYVLLKEKK